MELQFCERKSLNYMTLRITFDAKNQLRDLLTSSGFPEHCVEPIFMSNTGEDPNLDFVNRNIFFRF